MARKRRRRDDTAPAASASGSAAGEAARVPIAAPKAAWSMAVLLLGSGFAALVYETLWVKQLGRVVGVEVHAVTIALSAFFAGLALGSAVVGPLADRIHRPLRLYALLEAGVAVAGLVATQLLARSALPFVTLRESVGPLAWGLPFALVGAPAFFMGGTLPALVRALRPEGAAVAPATGLLYAANTAGAVLGTLATPFLLVPAFGITGTGVAAGTLGLVVCGAALALDRRTPPLEPAPAPQAAMSVDERSRDARVALGLYAAAGAVALGYEVVWAELLVQFLSTRTYAFAVMLGTYLVGLAVGSFLFARFARPQHEPWRTLGLLLAAAGASALALVAFMGSWLPAAQTFAGMWAMRLTGRETVEVIARFAVASAAALLVPTTLLGAAFPAAARLAAGAEQLGRGVGRVAAVNTAGGIAGTLLTGFLLVPRLGLVRSLAVLALAGALLGAIAIVKGNRGRSGAWGLAAALVALVAVLAAVTPPDRLARLLAAQRGGTLVFYEEDAGGTVAVLEQEAAPGAPTFRRLYIQGVSNSGDALPSLRYMRLQALLPVLVHPGEPRSLLVVGFGTGITAGATLASPLPQQRVVFELLPAVVRAGPLFQGNLGAASDPRIELRIGDGRQELLRAARRYDVVTLEPPPPSAAGVANLYSREFYELGRARLAEGGLLAQWWPLPTQNDEDSRSLVRSFLDVFPHVTLWTTELHEMLLVGSSRPLVLDSERISARFAAAETERVLAEVGVESPEALLATFVTDGAGLQRYVAGAPPVTDDRPLIEHGAWVRRRELGRVLPRLLELASDVPLPPGDPLRPAVEAERGELFAFYRASLLVMAGDPGEATRMLAEPLGRDPRNPYYSWVVRGGR